MTGKTQNNLAFVFPGQGSQALGMVTSLATRFPEVKHTFDRASEVLDLNLWDLVAEGPQNQLDQTHNTQPAMLAAGFSIWQVWCRQSAVRPAWFAGHSLGEYTALVCAEALAFEDGIRLVAARGRLMQEAVPEGVGAMAAILGLEDNVVDEVCGEAANGELVSAANFNSPGQVVIAGHAAAVERAMALAKSAGAKRALAIPVSVPSHCALMRPAADKLADYLLGIAITEPKIPIVHNAVAAQHDLANSIPSLLQEQLHKPVRWVDSIQFLHDQGINCFVECGPGKVLLGLNKRIVKDAGHFALYDPETLTQLLEHFND
jgi:[acyl-carrier-protein] S-malonyltransferase